MSAAAALLVLVSAFIHASWNIMARHGRSETGFIARMLPFVAIAGFVPALVGQWLTGVMAGSTWLYVAASGFFCAFYFLSLGRAYESSDFTIVYPVARALPVLLVAVGDAFQGQLPNLAGWTGMTLVVGGCIATPLRSRADLRPSFYLNRAGFWMLMTALGTVGYSLLDKRAANQLPPGPVSAIIYCYYFYFFTYVGYQLLARIGRRPAQPATGGGRAWMPATAGLLSFAGYFLVVWAYQLVSKASYVVAFRQSSLVIAVLMAFALYPQERHRSRLAAVLAITGGLVFISIYG